MTPGTHRGASCRGATRNGDRIATAALRQASRGKRRAIERDLIARILDPEEHDA